MKKIFNLDPSKEFEKFSKEVEELKDIWNSYHDLLLSYKAREEELKEANETKDILFSIISHDLRSPFQGLLGITGYLTEEFDSISKDEIKELISTLHEALKNQYNFLDVLLNWSRLQAGKIVVQKSYLNLFELVNRINNLLSPNFSNKNITFHNRINPNQIIYADEDLIYLLIQNLVSNAIKFTNENGKIEINSIDNLDSVQISVSDNGIGIKPESFDKIFRIETHYTTRGTKNEKGNGFGLALCKEIVTKHGGKIWFESELNKGTTFYCTIPTKIEL